MRPMRSMASCSVSCSSRPMTLAVRTSAPSCSYSKPWYGQATQPLLDTQPLARLAPRWMQTSLSALRRPDWSRHTTMGMPSISMSLVFILGTSAECATVSHTGMMPFTFSSRSCTERFPVRRILERTRVAFFVLRVVVVVVVVVDEMVDSSTATSAAAAAVTDPSGAVRTLTVPLRLLRLCVARASLVFVLLSMETMAWMSSAFWMPKSKPEASTWRAARSNSWRSA
mmetsp:Transcript_15957/g.48717  ORF Transcript_15957/g.48717 Transcript_15957/m.48717 type:complete len:227 (-) Transcript_15957:787-1467(-)